MDWKLAKNYALTFLLILNIILFSFNSLKQTKYKINSNQKAAILSYMKKNNITLNENTNIPNKFYPMEQFKVKNVFYDYLLLQQIFFLNNNNIKQTKEFDNIILTNSFETLTIYPTYVEYKNNKIINDFNFNKQNILNICEKYVKNIEGEYGKFFLDIVKKQNNFFYVLYTQKLKNQNIFNNVIEFKIYNNGTINIYFKVFNKVGFSGEKTTIYSADEVIYIFINEVKKIFQKNIIIEKIDIGYYLSDTLNYTENIILTPHYRFFIKDVETPFFINAYNGSFIY